LPAYSASEKVICFIGKLGGWSPGILPNSGSLLQGFPKQTPRVTARLNGALRSSVGLPKFEDLESFMARVDGEEASRFLKSAC